MYCCTAFRLSNEWPCSTWAQQHCLEPTQVQSRKSTKLQQTQSFLFVHSAVVSFCRFFLLCICVAICAFTAPFAAPTFEMQDVTLLQQCEVTLHMLHVSDHVTSSPFKARMRATDPVSEPNSYEITKSKSQRHPKTQIWHVTVDSMTVWHWDCIERFHKELRKCKGKV